MRIAKLDLSFLFLFLASTACGGGGSGGSGAGPVAGLGAIGFTPASGEVGSVVSIQGSGFSSDPFALTVRFGGEQGAPGSVQVATSSQILVTVPPGAKSGRIAVFSPSGTVLSDAEFRVLPTLLSLNPPSSPGAAVGDLVEILGYGFDGDVPSNNSVAFHGVPAPVLDATPSSIIASVPPGAQTGDLTIATIDGLITRPYTIKPSITSYSPNVGLAGDAITIHGFNFQNSPSANQVFFPGVAAAVIPDTASYGSLSVHIPAGFASTGTISVTTVDGTAIGPFFYFPTTPSISSFLPISGLGGATVVTIQGAGFLPGITTVKFNGLAAAIVDETTTRLDARVPAGASTGMIEVSHAFGSANTLALTPSVFTVLQTPTASGFSPSLGAWGSPVTITGTNFDPNPAGNVVRFNGVLAPVSNATPTQIIAQVPANSFSGLVTVETAAGLATAPSPFQVVFSRYALVANQIENTISSYEMDGALGTLRFQSYTPLGAGASPSSVATNPAGTLAFVANYDQNTVSSYALGLDGRLAFVDSKATGSHPAFVSVHPSGNFIYVANETAPCVAGSVSAYSVAPGGAMTPIGSGALGAQPTGIAMHPNGLMLYATASQPLSTSCPPPPPEPVTGGSVRTFLIDPATGALTPSFRTGVGDGPRALCIHPSGGWLYVVNKEEDTLKVFQTLSNGKLVFQQAIATGDAPVALAADPLARFLYAVNQGSNDISGYAIQPDGSLVSLGGNVPAGTTPSAIMLDFSGKAYVSNRGAGTISIFSVSPTGALSLLRSLSAHRGPASIARVDGSGPVVAVPRFAYAADTAIAPSGGSSSGVENSIVALAVASNGAVTVNGSPAAAGLTPVSLAADPTGSFLYASNVNAAVSGNAAVSMYRIQPDGTLLANGSVNVGGPGLLSQPAWLGTEPSGNFVFVKNTATPGIVSVFQIDRSLANLGKLNFLASYNITTDDTTEGQFGAVMHPTGRFLYLLTLPFASDPTLTSCSINPLTGEVTGLGSVNSGGNANRMTIHPNGLGLYVSNANIVNTVSFFAINASGVAQAALPSNSKATGLDPTGIAITPDARFLFTANRLSDTVSVFPVNGDGTLSDRLDANPTVSGTQDFDAGDEPFAVAVDRSGQFLFVTNAILTNGNTGLVRCFRIEADGRLTLVNVTAPPIGEKPQAITTVSSFQ